jgi:LPS-assembly protein
VLRGTSAFFILLLVSGRATAQVTPPAPVIRADYTNFDLTTGLGEAKGHAQIQNGSALLLADEFQFNRNTGLVTATGHFTITSGPDRLLAESGSYNLNTGVFTLSNLRAGEPPLYITAAAAAGTREKMALTNATVTYTEPGTFAPTLKADRIVYEPGKRILGKNGRLGLGDFRLLTLPKFDRPVAEPLVAYLTARVGYRHNLGAYVGVGLHLPVWPGIELGGEVGEYTARGLMAGPSGTYHLTADGDDTTGSFRSGFIDDHGDRGTDLLGRPVPAERGFFEWRHRQTIGERLTITGEFNWWKDSEILRDFRPNLFRPVQQPDSFVEGVYAGDNYYLDLFTRLAPNNFEHVQQRLPELRFDLLPTPIGGGFYERFNSSFAALQEDSIFSGPTLRSDRFDVFYSVDRPIMPTDWLSITPVVGGRLTYYAKAVGGRSNYTRWLGEVGVDAALRASGVFDYHSQIWGIDGLRHLLTPRLSYRYLPEVERGQAYIPPIDRQVFSTYLQPVDLGNMRNIDSLHGTHVLRLSLDNMLQTRAADYGSRDLIDFNLAADLNIATRPGQHRWSDVYTELSVTPASWLRLELFQRVSSRTLGLHEFNASFELIDHDWWSLRLSSTYLQQQIKEYFLEFDYRLNEVWKGFTRVHYDGRANRWNELSFGLRQNLQNTWNVRYEVSWNHGQQREGSFGLNLMVDLIRF